MSVGCVLVIPAGVAVWSFARTAVRFRSVWVRLGVAVLVFAVLVMVGLAAVVALLLGGYLGPLLDLH